MGVCNILEFWNFVFLGEGSVFQESAAHYSFLPLVGRLGCLVVLFYGYGEQGVLYAEELAHISYLAWWFFVEGRQFGEVS